MHRKHAVIGLASLVGAVLFAGSALAVVAVYSPTGHLNVRSGPGFQYPVVAQMDANTRFPVTGCLQDYSWCSVVVGSVTGWASAPYLVTDAGGKPTNLQVSGAQLGIPIVVPTGVAAVVATPPVGAMVAVPPPPWSSRSFRRLRFSPTWWDSQFNRSSSTEKLWSARPCPRQYRSIPSLRRHTSIPTSTARGSWSSLPAGESSTSSGRQGGVVPRRGLRVRQDHPGAHNLKGAPYGAPFRVAGLVRLLGNAGTR